MAVSGADNDHQESTVCMHMSMCGIVGIGPRPLGAHVHAHVHVWQCAGSDHGH